jgi:hypothetical protein
MKAKPSRRGFLRGTGLVAVGFATGGTIICAADYACTAHRSSFGVRATDFLITRVG